MCSSLSDWQRADFAAGVFGSPAREQQVRRVREIEIFSSGLDLNSPSSLQILCSAVLEGPDAAERDEFFSGEVQKCSMVSGSEMPSYFAIDRRRGGQPPF
jgi:hypothetical protein